MDSFRPRLFLQEINSKFEGTFTALQGHAKVRVPENRWYCYHTFLKYSS